MSELINTYLHVLRTIFEETRDKHEANRLSAKVLEEMSADRRFLTEVLRKHISRPANLNTLHYPVVGIDIDLNEHFGLVANCWIPLPDRSTNMSTKSIHHHGDMLLSTVTAFGPGYEHWMFETPSVVDASRELYDLRLLERSLHGLNHVAFVAEYIAHLPIYPSDLTITYALWTSRFRTTWKERVKRAPLLRGQSERLRRLAVKLGLAKQLELKVVEYFDFYPSTDGFRGIREREEFPRTNNDDYLTSLFYIIQRTGNDAISRDVREVLKKNSRFGNRKRILELVDDLENGIPIEGRLSPSQFNMERANFTKDAILQALMVRSGSDRLVRSGERN